MSASTTTTTCGALLNCVRTEPAPSTSAPAAATKPAKQAAATSACVRAVTLMVRRGVTSVGPTYMGRTAWRTPGKPDIRYAAMQQVLLPGRTWHSSAEGKACSADGNGKATVVQQE